MKLVTILLLMASVSLSSCKNKSIPPVYDGKDISGIAEVTHNKNTKETILTIQTDGKWKLYTGARVETISRGKPLAEGKGSGVYTLPVSDTVRNYFQLVTEDGKAILAERHLPMEGGYNFRDLGGKKTADGRFVKWGKIFRSDDLGSLTERDLNYLASIPLVSIVDFRSEEERSQTPDKIPASVKEIYPYAISPGNLMASADFSMQAMLDTDSIMIAINRMLVTDPQVIKRYQDFFLLLQNEEKTPLLFHCSAGKDRTGLGAAWILLALGVDEEAVMQDYLLSNIYLRDKYAGYIEQFPSLKSLFSVKHEFLQAGIDRIKETYGSVDNYLQGTLGADIAKLREMYLY
ncbi:MAG: tyrosine-protein phosphatase [Tannerellaceae bacterium]|jgi:protein-tyrosine phosphatase|nr:tyrosine-protein phosphatase [Tannerellaceae bacterium]